MFHVSYKTVREMCFAAFLIIALLASLVCGAVLLTGCATTKPDVGNIAPQEPTNPDAAEFMREAWTGLIIVSDNPDFDKKEVVIVQSFDSRVNTWGYYRLAFKESAQSARGDYRKFIVPEEFQLFSITAVYIWKTPLNRKYAVTYEMRLDDDGEICTLEAPSAEMGTHSSWLPCMGICGRIFKIRLEGEPLNMEPYHTCVRMLKRE